MKGPLSAMLQTRSSSVSMHFAPPLVTIGAVLERVRPVRLDLTTKRVDDDSRRPEIRKAALMRSLLLLWVIFLRHLRKATTEIASM